jgi:hypothetical protein
MRPQLITSVYHIPLSEMDACLIIRLYLYFPLPKLSISIHLRSAVEFAEGFLRRLTATGFSRV